MMTENDTLESVKNYYGKILTNSKDLITNVCCSTDAMPVYLREKLKNIHSDIQDKFYGCGSPIPYELEGTTVLDLGCGTGRDVYLMAQLVGSNGKVIGIDMTEDQLEVAMKYEEYHFEKFGFKNSNVDFKKGYIEDLAFLDIEDNSIDVITSNCVINLSPAKNKVYSEIYRVLKPGGEFFFSDIFSDRRIPMHLTVDPVLYGECLSGALYKEDFRRIMQKVGFADYRIVETSEIIIDNKDVEEKVGFIKFESLTVRALKLESLEDICEDYGQIATYLGTIKETPHLFELDTHHIFETDKPKLVCGNTIAMLQETRYEKHFKIVGDKTKHFGPFNCTDVTANSSIDSSGACC